MPAFEVPDFSETIEQNPQNGGPIGSDFFDTENEWRATKIGETVNGKGVQVMKDLESSFYIIAFSSGGELPAGLQGKFTSYSRAEVHARSWLSDHYAKAASASAKS